MIYTNEMIKKKNDKKRKQRKIVQWIVTPIIVIILCLAIYICYQKYIKKSSSISIFGFQFYTVMTGSMEPEYQIGDLIIEKKIKPDEIQENDIITYAIDNTNTLTHRVIEIVKEDQTILYRTKGDNNNSADSELVKYDQIKGHVIFKIDKLGKLITKFVSGIGILIILILVTISYIRASRSEEKRIAREDARRRYNIPKYKKEKSL